MVSMLIFCVLRPQPAPCNKVFSQMKFMLPECSPFYLLACTPSHLNLPIARHVMAASKSDDGSDPSSGLWLPSVSDWTINQMRIDGRPPSTFISSKGLLPNTRTLRK